MMSESETSLLEEPRFNEEGVLWPLTGHYEHLAIQTLPPGTVLFREGDQPEGVYLLRSGEISLVHTRPGKEDLVDMAIPGRVLGLSAVLTFRDHLATAVAKTECELSFIEREEFRRLVDEYPDIWFSLLHQLSQDVMHSYDVIRRDFWKKSSAPHRAGARR